jgi:hypothetical protein
MTLLPGGSPCAHWSIAQTRNRETKPEGLDWGLFRNYLIARERYGFTLYSADPVDKGEVFTAAM